jgi:hypothetical protein
MLLEHSQQAGDVVLLQARNVLVTGSTETRLGVVAKVRLQQLLYQGSCLPLYHKPTIFPSLRWLS